MLSFQSMFAVLLFATALLASEQNPPQWPSSVKVFDPTSTDIGKVIAGAYAVNGGQSPPDNGQFSSARYAFLFKPGTYTADVPVGYYTQVLGVGTSPDDVIFNGRTGVYCVEGTPDFRIGALNTFWRSAENFRMQSANGWWNGASGMLWAVSQASPLRRVHVDNNLLLFQYQYGDAAGFASGGFMANSKVSGTVNSGSQQQWVTRNSDVRWLGGVWNMVFVGTKGAPSSHCGDQKGTPYVTIPTTPVVIEKPFISVDSSNVWFLNVPQVRFASVGVDWSTGTQIRFEQVYVTQLSDTADIINAKLSAGLHVVVSPGIYQLDAPLHLRFKGQVLLGLGLATLVSAAGNAVIQIDNVDGVRVAGLLLQAGAQRTSVLLQWGSGGYGGNSNNPGLISDVYVRVGGPDSGSVQADVMMKIDSGNVIIDNVWLWRADHGVNGIVVACKNPSLNGLVVNGDDVTLYGGAVEHHLQDLRVWNGERGRVYFFQAELPYDVTQQQYASYTGYRVSSKVKSQEAHGVGIYHFFRDYAVTVSSGIIAPATAQFNSPFTIYLNGMGTIVNVLNSAGGSSSKTTQHGAWLCNGTTMN